MIEGSFGACRFDLMLLPAASNLLKQFVIHPDSD
jgi:hypothetical protein